MKKYSGISLTELGALIAFVAVLVVGVICLCNYLVERGRSQVKTEAVNEGVAEFYKDGNNHDTFRWIKSVVQKRSVDSGKLQVRIEAIKVGVAEYYLDDDNKKKFRWIKLKSKPVKENSDDKEEPMPENS